MFFDYPTCRHSNLCFGLTSSKSKLLKNKRQKKINVRQTPAICNQSSLWRLVIQWSVDRWSLSHIPHMASHSSSPHHLSHVPLSWPKPHLLTHHHQFIRATSITASHPSRFSYILELAITFSAPSSLKVGLIQQDCFHPHYYYYFFANRNKGFNGGISRRECTKEQVGLVVWWGLARK